MTVCASHLTAPSRGDWRLAQRQSASTRLVETQLTTPIRPLAVRLNVGRTNTRLGSYCGPCAGIDDGGTNRRAPRVTPLALLVHRSTSRHPSLARCSTEGLGAVHLPPAHKKSCCPIAIGGLSVVCMRQRLFFPFDPDDLSVADAQRIVDAFKAESDRGRAPDEAAPEAAEDVDDDTSE